MERGEREVQLTLGSKYLVRSIMTREQVLETEGVFRDAIVLELGPKAGALKGKLCVIPTHMLVSIDTLEAVKPRRSGAGPRRRVRGAPARPCAGGAGARVGRTRCLAAPARGPVAARRAA